MTGGIGWGRLAGTGEFRNPLSFLNDGFRTRDDSNDPLGGKVNEGNWFRGDAALFGGVQWRATDRLTLTAEYSSDSNPNETPSAFEREIPFNFGASYALRPGVDVAARYLYGSELGVQLSMALNPKDPPAGSGRDPAPPPVVPRVPHETGDLGWPEQAAPGTAPDTAAGASSGASPGRWPGRGSGCTGWRAAAPPCGSRSRTRPTSARPRRSGAPRDC